MLAFPDLPHRPSKPRHEGLTHVIDTGLSARGAQDLVEVAGNYVDIVKLGWGTAVVTGGLERKLDVYRDAGLPVTCGGTLVEAAIQAGSLDALLLELDRLGIEYLEVSDGAIELPRERKLELIAELAGRFTVLSEVGFKDDREVDVDEWATWAQQELGAGAWKVVTEARESGTTGIYDNKGVVKSSVIERLCESVSPADLIFEAPQKAQQVWFLRALGPNANLGNIAPSDVVSLETLRLGLRGDTLQDAAAWPRPAGAAVGTGEGPRA